MEHKAFVFNYAAFKVELKNILEEALASGRNDRLIGFINDHRNVLVDPYEGDPLPAAWERLISPQDAHQYGDYALTKFYNPRNNVGLRYRWESIYEVLQRESAELSQAVLGHSCGVPPHVFDPGKMGAYFQSAELVKQNLVQVIELTRRKTNLEDQLQPLIQMLKIASSESKGLYITF